MLRPKRTVIIIIGSLIIFVAAVVLFASPLSKYLVEKYDERYTGRQIKMDWAYVNPFTGFLHFDNLKIYELRKDTLFFSAKGVTANFAMWKLLSKTVEINELIIDHPIGKVNNDKKHFNFDDLIVRFSPDTSSQKKSSIHVNVLRVKIRHGEFGYKEKAIPIDYVIKDVNMESSGRRWDADTIASAFSFLSQDRKGGIMGNFTINVKSNEYRLTTTVRDFDLEIIRQYLWELINYGMFSAKLNATIKATGNFNNPKSIDVHGRLALIDFRLGKTLKDNYAAFDRLVVVIERVSPMNQKFLFDSITLLNPIVKYERFDSLDNVERLFGREGSNISDVTAQASRFNLVIEIGLYLKKLSQNFFQSHYRVNALTVKNGDLKFNDYSLSEQFNISASALSIRADSIDKKNKRINVSINSQIKPYGDLSINLSINPKDSGDFDMQYHLNKMSASSFNPYLISYTSFPLDRGTIELNGVWNVRNGEIRSVNHLIIVDPRASRRIKNTNLKWIPLPLVLALIRERGNVIDYEIPISGNLKNPRFHLRDVVIDLLKNVFIKPITVPYGIVVRTVENEIENSLTLKWDMRQRELHHKQKHFIKTMASFLAENKTSSITVYSREYSVKEKEQILFFEAKKKYFLFMRGKNEVFTKEDSLTVDKTSIKDAAFMHALKKGKGAGDTLMFSIQDKCQYYVGGDAVNSQYMTLVRERDRVFREFFVNNGTSDRVKINSSNDSIPYDGFSSYKINYHGEIPKALRSAYEEMHELNTADLRKKYAADRELPEMK